MATQPSVVQEVDLPPSQAAQAEPITYAPDDMLEQVANEQLPEEEGLLESINVDLERTNSIDRGDLTGSALVLALARQKPEEDPEMSLAGGGLDEARHLLRTLQDKDERIRLSMARTQSQLTALARLNYDPVLSDADRQDVNQAYGRVLQWDAARDARVAAENAALDRIEDMAARDPVQAKVLMDNLEKGDANKVKRDFQIKMLKLAQLAEVYETERQEEGWGSFLINLALGLVPTNYNFSRTGIVETGNEGWFDWLTPGTALSEQGTALWALPVDEFAEAVREGGSFDKAIRANADDFLFGKYDPSAAVSIVGDIKTQTESDREWANIWGAVEVASAIPINKVSSATRALVTAGARKEAVGAIRETAEAIVNEGTDAAAKKWGLNTKEVVDGQSISMVNPDVSTPNFVPLGLDVAARDEAARRALADLPGIAQIERLTDPVALKAAYDELVKQAEIRFGREVKDVSPVKTEILADGSEVKYVEVTFGKKGGGGYASNETARNAARKMGVPGAEIDELIETNVKIVGGIPEGYTMKVYHGTDAAYAEGRVSHGGKLGPGYYMTPDADTATDYAGLASHGDPNVRPYFVNPDKIWGMKNLEGWSIADMRAAYKDLGLADDGFLDEAERMMADRASKGHNPVMDSQTFIKQLQRDVAKHTLTKDEMMAGMGIGDDLNALLASKGYDGIAGNMWGDLEIAIFDPKNAYSQFTPFKTITDVSGQHFIKTRINMTETSFFTNFDHVPTATWWSRLVGTAPRVTDTLVHGKAVQAGSTVARMQRIMANKMKDSFGKLSRGERQLVGQIAAAGTNAERWWTDTEFNLMAQRAYGRAATPRELQAYRDIQAISDMDYVLRNDLIYKELAIQGVENVTINTPWNQKFEVLGRVKYNPSKKPDHRIFDASTGKHYNSKFPLSDAKFQAMINDGYALVEIKGSIKLPDGTNIKTVMIKKSDAEFPGLKKQQLAYAEGGHRLYEADYRYFAKQASVHTQPDTGTKVLQNPNTFVAGKTITEVKEWTKIMNRALARYRDNPSITAGDLDAQVFLEKAGFPSGEDFLRQVKDGHISTKHDFEAVFDRELPSAYVKESTSAVSYLDLDDLGPMDYLANTGRRFYAGKGNALKDTRGNIAATVDPFDALATSLRQITRQSGLSNYKIEALERFTKTYGEYLEPGKARSAMEIFNDAPIKRGTPRDIKDQIEAQRAATRHVLGFETPLERVYQERTRQFAEQLLGEGNSAARKIAHDAVWWFKTKDPVSKLRGLAFDSKLGMFNIGQLFIQTSTIASAITLSPKLGFQGAMGILPLHGYMLSRGSEAMLDTISKRGVWKSMGFTTEVEFKEYARGMYNSGFLDMNGTHVMVGEHGSAATFGSFGERAHAIRETSRVFFYTAETYNRIVAYRIAYGEALAKGAKVTDGDFRARVMALADDYSFNMTSESASWWQKGLLSIPTQFWAYNVRMMDAMFGARFTPAQRMRLAGMQVMLAGSAGVPIVDAIADYSFKQSGQEPRLDTIAGTFNRGFLDRLALEVTGADVKISEKYGTGGWLTNTVKDIFGAGEYGDKPFDEMVGGASWSITKSALGAIGSTVAYAHAEGGAGTMTKDGLLKMAMEVSTFSNAMKANLAHNYGMYRSKAGTVIADDLPSSDAFFIALGFPPAEQEYLSHQMAYLKDHKEGIKEAGRQVANWRQEAMNVPDKHDENMEKVRAFIQLQRPEDRAEILKQANMSTDESLYDSVARKYNEQTMREQALNGEAN